MTNGARPPPARHLDRQARTACPPVSPAPGPRAPGVASAISRKHLVAPRAGRSSTSIRCALARWPGRCRSAIEHPASASTTRKPASADRVASAAALPVARPATRTAYRRRPWPVRPSVRAHLRHEERGRVDDPLSALQRERIATHLRLPGRHQLDLLAEAREPCVGHPGQVPRDEPGRQPRPTSRKIGPRGECPGGARMRVGSTARRTTTARPSSVVAAWKIVDAPVRVLVTSDLIGVDLRDLDDGPAVGRRRQHAAIAVEHAHLRDPGIAAQRGDDLVQRRRRRSGPGSTRSRRSGPGVVVVASNSGPRDVGLDRAGAADPDARDAARSARPAADGAAERRGQPRRAGARRRAGASRARVQRRRWTCRGADDFGRGALRPAAATAQAARSVGRARRWRGGAGVADRRRATGVGDTGAGRRRLRASAARRWLRRRSLRDRLRTSAETDAYSMTNGPTSTRSPGASLCSLIGLPLTRVPFREPRSRTNTSLPDDAELRVLAGQQGIGFADLAGRIAADRHACRREAPRGPGRRSGRSVCVQQPRGLTSRACSADDLGAGSLAGRDEVQGDRARGSR